LPVSQQNKIALGGLGWKYEEWDTSIIVKMDIKEIRREGVDQIYLPPNND